MRSSTSSSSVWKRAWELLPILVALVIANGPAWFAPGEHAARHQPLDFQGVRHDLVPRLREVDASNLVVIAGNSYSWTGLRPSVLAEAWPDREVLNLAVGNANTFFLLQHLFDHGIVPGVVIAEINARNTGSVQAQALKRLQTELPLEGIPLTRRWEQKLRDATAGVFPRIDRPMSRTDLVRSFADKRAFQKNFFDWTDTNAFGILKSFGDLDRDGHLRFERIVFQVGRDDTIDRYVGAYVEILEFFRSMFDEDPSLSEAERARRRDVVHRLRAEGSELVFVRLPREPRVTAAERELFPDDFAQVEEIAAEYPDVYYLDYSGAWDRYGRYSFDGAHYLVDGATELSRRVVNDLRALWSAAPSTRRAVAARSRK
jgi:hypothetical protein